MLQGMALGKKNNHLRSGSLSLPGCGAVKARSNSSSMGWGGIPVPPLRVRWWSPELNPCGMSWDANGAWQISPTNTKSCQTDRFWGLECIIKECLFCKEMCHIAVHNMRTNNLKLPETTNTKNALFIISMSSWNLGFYAAQKQQKKTCLLRPADFFADGSWIMTPLKLSQKVAICAIESALWQWRESPRWLVIWIEFSSIHYQWVAELKLINFPIKTESKTSIDSGMISSDPGVFQAPVGEKTRTVILVKWTEWTGTRSVFIWYNCDNNHDLWCHHRS